MALSTHLVHRYDQRHPAPALATLSTGPRQPHTPRYFLSDDPSNSTNPDHPSNRSATHLTSLQVEAEQKQQQYSSKPHDGLPLAFGLHHGTSTIPDHESKARRLGSHIEKGMMGYSSSTVPNAGAVTPAANGTQASMFNLPTQASGMGMEYSSSAFGGVPPMGTYSAFQHHGMGMSAGGSGGGFGGGYGGGGGNSEGMMLSNYSASQIATLQSRLSKKLGPEYITQRAGPGGSGKLSYIEGWKVINLANEVFGFNGWSSQIVSLTTDYCDPVGEPTSGRFNVGVSSIIRITLRDGVYHEDIGSGSCDNTKGKGICLEKAKKEAVTDGVKRTLKSFGNLLGNCLYDKDYAKEVAKIKVVPKPLQPKDLWRRPEYDEEFQASAEAGPSRPHPMLAGRNEAGSTNGTNYGETQSAMSTPAPASRFSNMGPPQPPMQGQAQSANAQNRMQPRPPQPQLQQQQQAQQATRPLPAPGVMKAESIRHDGLTPAQRRASAAGLAIERPVSTDYDASFAGDDDVFAALTDYDDPSLAGVSAMGGGLGEESFDDSVLGPTGGVSGVRPGNYSNAQHQATGNSHAIKASTGAEMRRLALQGQLNTTSKPHPADAAIQQQGSGSSGGSHGSGDTQGTSGNGNNNGRTMHHHGTRMDKGPSPPSEIGYTEHGGMMQAKPKKVGMFNMPGRETPEQDGGFGNPSDDGSGPSFASAKGLKRTFAGDSGDGFGYPAGNYFSRPEQRQALGEIQPTRSGHAEPPDPKRYRPS